ncbi:reverse transcriptase domain-containing protein [Tanacetum coccineum]
MNPNNNQGPPPMGPIPQNLAPDLRTMEELCQSTINGRGGSIAPINIQDIDFGLMNHRIQQSMKQNGVPHDVLRLCLFPYSLTHHATAWFDRLPKNSIHSWEEMVTKFLSKYFPPSMVTKLRNDISNFRQLPDKSLIEAWELARLVVVHIIIPSVKPPVASLKGTYMLLRETTMWEGALPSNTIPNPREDIKVITTWSGITLAGPSVPSPNPPPFSKEVERDPKTTMDQVHISSSGRTVRVPSSVIQPSPVSKSTDIPERNPHQPLIPYPLRLNKEKLQDKSDIQITKFLEIFKKLHFNISLVDALAQMPKYAKMLKYLLNNKEKLLELANTLLNENCSAVLLNKLLEKLGDPGKFLIPFYFKELEVDKFTFPADFVIVDYDVDPRVPLILGRPFSRRPVLLVTGWRVCIDCQKLNDATRKDHFPLSFMDQMLERLAENEFYCFLDGFSGMPFGLCNASGTFQWCMVAIFHDMIEKTMEVFMDDFLVFGDSFSSCLSHLDMMLKRYEDTNLVLNWEKCHFMVKEGIVLGHKISKNSIEVDRAKVDVISKLPPPTTVKGI